MTSAMCPPRNALGPCSPRTQEMASTRFDLPEPLGPTITLMPGVNSREVLSAKDLKPRTVSERRNIGGDANKDVIRSLGRPGKPRPDWGWGRGGTGHLLKHPRFASLAAELAIGPARPGSEHLQRVTRNSLSPTGSSSVASTSSTRDHSVPSRHHWTMRSTAAGEPSNTASTRPSGRFRTRPARTRARARWAHSARKKTPWTRPETWRWNRFRGLGTD